MSESSIPTLALIPLEALTLELLLSESPLQTANTPAFTQHEPLQTGRQSLRHCRDKRPQQVSVTVCRYSTMTSPSNEHKAALIPLNRYLIYLRSAFKRIFLNCPMPYFTKTHHGHITSCTNFVAPLRIRGPKIRTGAARGLHGRQTNYSRQLIELRHYRANPCLP